LISGFSKMRRAGFRMNNFWDSSTDGIFDRRDLLFLESPLYQIPKSQRSPAVNFPESMGLTPVENFGSFFFWPYQHKNLGTVPQDENPRNFFKSFLIIFSEIKKFDRSIYENFQLVFKNSKNCSILPKPRLVQKVYLSTRSPGKQNWCKTGAKTGAKKYEHLYLLIYNCRRDVKNGRICYTSNQYSPIDYVFSCTGANWCKSGASTRVVPLLVWDTIGSRYTGAYYFCSSHLGNWCYIYIFIYII
jgi:hypothetical protein